MASESGSAARSIGGTLVALVFLGAAGTWLYLRESAHPSERGAAACQAVESYIASISHHHSEAAWRTTTPAYQAAHPLADQQAAWRALLHGHGRITSVAVLERSASLDYSQVTIRATLGTADTGYAPQLDYDVRRAADGTMHVDSGCQVTESGCTPGAF